MSLNENFLGIELPILATRRAELVKQIVNTERYSVVLSGLIWVWLISEHSIENILFVKIIAFMPLLLTVMGGLRSYGINKDLHLIDNYVLLQEEKIRPEENIGFEHFRIGKKTSKKSILGISAWIFWSLLAIMNILLIIVSY